MVRQAVTLVGRDAECHLCLSDDDQIAARHARFEEHGTGVFLSSLSVEHPVERNGEAIQEEVRLVHNDELRIGQTLVQFQYIIAPHSTLRQSPGLLQPATLLIVAAILLLEVGLLLFLVNWPQYIIRPETERADLAFAEKLRAEKEIEKATQSNVASRVDAASSVVTLPGTATKPSDPPSKPISIEAPTAITPSESAPSGPTPPESIVNPPLNPPAIPSPTSSPPEILEVLEEADFTPADTNTVVVDLPPISVTDPRIEDARRMLAEATAAAQFSDYSKASRLLNQIHKALPGFIPAHIEHARLFETRGNLDSAQQRWTQIIGLAPQDSPFHSLAIQERKRLERIQTLQTQTLKILKVSDLASMPRHIRIMETEIKKMPPDSDVAEERKLTSTLKIASQAPIFKDAAIQVFITFYDIDSIGQVRPTRAITTPSPLVLGKAFANRGSIPLEATYVVPRGLRSQEKSETGEKSSYYGYTIHIFAGQILQDAKAKPKKLLKRPIQVLPSTPAPP